MITDDQFKDMVSHNLIIMKHSIRNLNEKFDLMIERSSKLSQSSNLIHEDDIADNYTNLNCIFPINDVNTLNDIEEQLAADKTYHKLMVICLYCGFYNIINSIKLFFLHNFKYFYFFLFCSRQIN